MLERALRYWDYLTSTAGLQMRNERDFFKTPTYYHLKNVREKQGCHKVVMKPFRWEHGHHPSFGHSVYGYTKYTAYPLGDIL